MTRSAGCAKRSPAVTSKLEQIFLAELALELHGEVLEIVPEHRFHPVRKWRFDIAIPELRIAVEINGGIWNAGRHTRGAGQLKDYEKFNAATELGWSVFQYGPNQVRDSSASLQVAQFVRLQLHSARCAEPARSMPADALTS